MIAALIGRIFEVRADAVLVDVHGVVYQVMTSGRTVAAAGEVGSDIIVQTRLIVRDDAQVLYGFLTRAELQWFESLINVSGIGPRLACAMLTRFSPEELLTVIEAENVTLLSTVPGIGKRTASRILLDLRGKLPADLTTTTAGSLPRLGGREEEVVAALQSLGYTANEALDAAARSDVAETATIEDRIVAALRIIGA
ncbi:MAG: Holliday junction branch migration protein RuvA [Thermomicrobiales bacterium]